MAGYGYSREAVRVKVKKCESCQAPEWRKFSVDPQITSLEVLYSILAKAFDLKTDFGISYKTLDVLNKEIYLPVLSDWDLEASFLRAHNQSITSASEPCLNLRVDIKPFSEAPDWDSTSNNSTRETSSAIQQSIGAGQRYVQNVQNRLPGLIINHMEKTFSSFVQRAMNLVEDPTISHPPRPPLSDIEFRSCFLDSVGQIMHTNELRKVIYTGGIDPSLRRVVWKHILNVYPDGMTGRQRMDYMKEKAAEYCKLRECWKTALHGGSVVGELAYVTSMVRKDVLRTDRLHSFYAGSDDNQNIASLFNILTTYALNHPAVSYCQGMSDIASPLLVTMGDEAHAYICFCAVMIRLKSNFMLDGIAMTQKFTHLSEALQYYDPEFFEYLKVQQADDLLFCYRWLLLEMKREFAFEDALRMLEVLWSSLPSSPPDKELNLFEKLFIPPDILPPKSPSVILRTPRENAYTKICALRRQSSAVSLLSNNSFQKTSESTNKLNESKRMNQSLDENTSRNKITNPIKSHQSLDETKLNLLSEQTEIIDINVVDKCLEPEKINDVVLLTDNSNLQRSRSISPNINPNNSIISYKKTDAESCKQQDNNLATNKTLFSNSTGNLISNQPSKRNGHFKDLKEKIATTRKGIFSSLDKIELERNSTEDRKPTTSLKVVKNFNEFLNFASINKNELSDRFMSKKSTNCEETKTLSLQQTTHSDSLEENGDTSCKDDAQKFFPNNKSIDKTFNLDGSSPDDSQEYFPMTTSMTREVRLELENLDRHVFGSDFHQRQFNCLAENQISEQNLNCIKKNSGKYSEIEYAELNQNSIDVFDDSIAEINNSDGVLTNSNRIQKCMKDENRVKRKNASSANNDIFIWENPLHKYSGNVPFVDGREQRIVSQSTPDEQLELEFDGEIVDEQGKKSITPIRLVRKNGDRSNRNSIVLNKCSDSDNSDSSNDNKIFPTKLNYLNNPFIEDIEFQLGTGVTQMVNSCEEASEANNINVIKISDESRISRLPTSKEFGGGNPFLMFLCLSIILQHRDYVMKNAMDYNEMAMHFDKMVRKHNVTRVLNQARRMYSEYLKSQKNNVKLKRDDQLL